MALSLTAREKKLLSACITALVLMATFVILSQFLGRRKTALAKIAALESQKRENASYLEDKEFWNKRATWLQDTMPTTESLGTAQAQLLEEIQNVVLDYGLAFQKQPVLLPESNEAKQNAAVYREAAVEVRLRGDQTTVLSWLATLQSPEKFQAVKQLELEIDSRAKEKTPQVLCNLVLARWFKPANGL